MPDAAPASAYLLHGFPESGNAYKVALMLALSGAEWRHVFVDFFNGGARTPEFLALNPMGEAPVLETPAGPDGRRAALSQSGAILTRLARDLGRFGPRSEAEADEILRWLLWDNHKLTGYTAPLRFMRRFAPEEKRDAGAMAFLDGRRRIAFKLLEARLTAQPWVALGDRATIADLSCCGYLFWLDQLGESAADWPAIGAWLERIRALPGWAAPETLMPRG